jgi:hypothetical protein
VERFRLFVNYGTKYWRRSSTVVMYRKAKMRLSADTLMLVLAGILSAGMCLGKVLFISWKA